MIRFRRRPGGFPQSRFPENPFPTMRFLPIASLCAFALCAGAADSTRFSLFRSDSDGEDGSGAGSSVFSLDDSAVRLVGLEEPADAPAGGQPAVAILCHGFSATKESPLFDALSKAFRKRGVSVARFDFNGHGESEGAFRDMTVSNEVLDARTVVDYYRDVRNARVALVGHSQGGVVAALAAAGLGAENVSSLVLLAPAAVLREDALRGRIFDAVFDPLDPPETIPVFGGARELGRDYVLDAQRTDPYAAIASYAGPVLVLHGRGDTVVPWTFGERFVSGRLNGRFTLLPTADHAFTGVEKAVADDVAQFVVACFRAEEAPAPEAEEAPSPSTEEAIAEIAEIEEALTPAVPEAEEEQAANEEIAAAPSTIAPEAEIGGGPGEAEPPPAAEEEPAESAEAAPPAVPEAEIGGGSGEAEPPPVETEPATVAGLAAAYPPVPVDPAESVFDILVAPNGFTWQGFEVSEEDLFDRIRAFGRSEPGSHIRIQTFPEIPFETLKAVLTALKDAGFARVSVQMPAAASVPAP